VIVLIKSELYSVFIGVAIIAFTMGLIFEVFDEGETAKLKVFSSFVESKMDLLIQEAELAGVPVEIQSGDVGFTIEVLTDDEGFFINAITECKFETTDEVPHKTCVICQLNDENGEALAWGREDLDFINSGDLIIIDITEFDKTFLVDGKFTWSNSAILVHEVLIGICLQEFGFLIIDEDGIDNGLPPNFFSDIDVNDHIAEIGLRDQLPFFAAHIGETITLYTGEVGDEGWFAPQFIPPSWDAAGPSSEGLANFFLAGPGLGSPDSEGNRESILDKISNVIPLRADGLEQLEGGTFCALVYDSDISINYDAIINGNLKGSNLGFAAFEVLVDGVNVIIPEISSSTLPSVDITILDANEVCAGDLNLSFEAPHPVTSSEPFDINPEVVDPNDPYR